MELITLKMVTGEEVLGEVVGDSETEYVLENPVAIVMMRDETGQVNTGFAPFPIHAPQVRGATIPLKKSHVVYHYVPAPDFIKHYEQTFGSGLIVPKATIPGLGRIIN